MRVRCVRDFHDLQAGVRRSFGDVFECTAERFAEINSAGYGELVEAVRPRKKREDNE